MGRRKKGRNISGWVLIDKPKDIGSTSVVGKVRAAFDAQKAGHAGTLDPAATGLLAVAMGEATKTIPHVTQALKAYEFTVRFGQTTDTDDAEGQVLYETDKRPDDATLRHALQAFQGDIEQVPPHYSAIKIQGVRAYELARNGVQPEIQARPLYIGELSITARPDPDHAHFYMECGKGGYVRAIARDLGAALGCGAHVKTLRRLWSGPFHVDNALSWERLLATGPENKLDASYLLPLEAGLTELPEVYCDAPAAKKLANGNSAMITGGTEKLVNGDLVWASYQGKALAIGTFCSGALQPSRVFRL